jgi:hypothetical protein
MGDLLRTINEILAGESGQITIRHLYYRLVGLHAIEKTEAAYKSLCAHLSKWRRSGDIAWSAFTDSTRWHIRDTTYNSVRDALQNTVENYRRDLWQSQPVYVEVWVEKDAMAGIVSATAGTFGVPVFVARGFASLSSLYSAAATFRNAIKNGKQVIIYHLGDFDPSGVAAGESIKSTFRDDFNVEIEFVRAAVTAEQIEEFNLPTRPTKQSDSRARRWTGGECVELDTMPPDEIRSLVESCITRHINRHRWEASQQAEELERESLANFFAKWEAA